MMFSLDSLKPLIIWIGNNPKWGVFFTFFIAFLESIMFVGLFIPGSAILAAIGVLIGAEIISFHATLLAAILGAFLGDVLSFAIARYYKDSFRNISFFQRHYSWLKSGEKFFARHGGKGIFIGRFIGPIRPILPMVAGMLQMPWLRFLTVDFFSAILWAPSFMLPGIIIGAASQTLNKTAASYVIIFFLFVFLLCWLLCWLSKKFYFYTKSLCLFFAQKLWLLLLDSRFSHYFKFLKLEDNPKSPILLICFMTLLLSLVGFILLTILTINIGEEYSLNLAIWHLFRSLYSTPVEKLGIIISLCFSPFNLFIMWLAFSLYLGLNERYEILKIWLILGCFAIGSSGIIKHMLNIPRPGGLNHSPLDPSFPSTHTTIIAALFPFLAQVLSYKGSKRFKKSLFITSYFLVFIVAINRLTLGVHWFGDIVGSFLLGTFFFLSAKIAYSKCSHPKLSMTPIAIMFSLIFSIGLCLQCYASFTRLSYDYRLIWPEIYLSMPEWWKNGYSSEPLYRKNRLGKAVQTLNIQWYDELDKIKNSLLKKGWQIKSQVKLLGAINYFNINDSGRVSPVLTGVFNDQAPQLEMVKMNHAGLVILRLWQSFIYITPEEKPLFVGTISYDISTKTKSVREALETKINTLPNPQLMLTQTKDKIFEYKLIPIHHIKPLYQHDDHSWFGSLLLIRSVKDKN